MSGPVRPPIADTPVTIQPKYIQLLKTVVMKNVENQCKQCSDNKNNFNLFQSLVAADNNDELIKAKIYEQYLNSKLDLKDVDTIVPEDFELSDYNIVCAEQGGLYKVRILLYDKADVDIDIEITNPIEGLSAEIYDDYIYIRWPGVALYNDILTGIVVKRGDYTQTINVTLLADKTSPLYNSLTID